YGAQIADALARAHRAGIVHRDLKPGNVMITKGGAKLLDFGLAKSAARGPRAGPDSFSQAATGATAFKPLTAEGSVVGTFQYMAPEQLAGEDADERTDVFALGAVLYEMATGTRAFDGKTKTSLIAQIIGADPRPIRDLQPVTPAAFEHIVQRCLAKEPEDRWQSARDIAAQLLWLQQSRSDTSATIAPQPGRGRRSFAWPVAAALIALVAGGLAFALVREGKLATRLGQPIRFTMQPPTVSEADTNDWHARISPDGRSVLFCTDSFARSGSMWIIDLDSAQAHKVEGTEGGWGGFWAPDGKSIGYFAGGRLQRVSVSGGVPQPLADVSFARGGAWGSDTIIFARSTTDYLRRVPANGGPVTDALPFDRNEIAQRWPVFLPDEQHFLFISFHTGEQAGSG